LSKELPGLPIRLRKIVNTEDLARRDPGVYYSMESQIVQFLQSIGSEFSMVDSVSKNLLEMVNTLIFQDRQYVLDKSPSLKVEHCSIASTQYGL
jgi:hypothetical protein